MCFLRGMWELRNCLFKVIAAAKVVCSVNNTRRFMTAIYVASLLYTLARFYRSTSSASEWVSDGSVLGFWWLFISTYVGDSLRRL